MDAKVGPECHWSKYCSHLKWAVFKTLPFLKKKSWGSFVSLGLLKCFCNIIILIEYSEAVDTGKLHRLFCYCSAGKKHMSRVEISASQENVNFLQCQDFKDRDKYPWSFRGWMLLWKVGATSLCIKSINMICILRVRISSSGGVGRNGVLISGVNLYIYE